jgi:NADH-quinone oxidoreductase subunit A
VQHASILVDDRVDYRLDRPPVLRLNMEDALADGNVCIEARTHGLPIPLFAAQNGAANKTLGVHLTDALSGRYYSNVTNMQSSYLDNYAGLLLMFILACGLAGALIVLSAVIGRHKRTREKDQPYECGIRPTGDAREPISVQFYMVALVFILFDIEAIFLYPWALVYHDLKLFGFVEMVLYIIILLAGYIFLWKKGALDWNR